MFFYRPGWVFQQILYPRLLWRKPPDSHKQIFLTFDDGPVPELTGHVLDILNTHDVKATFFCVGDNIRKYPQIFKRLLQEGHQTGNHTFNHLNGWKTPAETYLQNAWLCQQEARKHGKEMALFRPPYGKIARKQIKALCKSYKIVMWDVLSGDYSSAVSAQQCLAKTLYYTRPGSIVVFHDNYKAGEKVLQVLPLYIGKAKERGYTFSTL